MSRSIPPLVIVTRKLPDPVEDRMRALFELQSNPTDTAFEVVGLKRALGSADIVVTTITDRVTSEVIEAAGPRLKLLANFGVGVDHIDLAAAASRGIVVSNTPGVLTEDTADLAMALILAVPRRLAEGMKTIERDAFHGWFPTWMMGHRLGGMQLGIVGMGRIGLAVAKRARAFGMHIHYHNRSPIAGPLERSLEATYWEDLDGMLAQMDMVSLHCPRNAETVHLLSARRLKLMKPTAYLINTARGDIIDEQALAECLARGELKGAGLDVFEHEPAITPQLKSLANVVLLPHMGSGTIEARTDMGNKVIANIEAFLDGRELPDRVAPPAR